VRNPCSRDAKWSASRRDYTTLKEYMPVRTIALKWLTGAAVLGLLIVGFTVAHAQKGPPPDKDSVRNRGYTEVPGMRSGVLVLIGRPARTGEEVPGDRVVKPTDGDDTHSYYGWKEGDTVKKGDLLARIDNRLAILEVEIAKARVDAATALLQAAEKTRQEARQRADRMQQLEAQKVVGKEEIEAAKLTAERYEAEVRSKKQDVFVAEKTLEAAQVIVKMHEIRSPVDGMIQTIIKKPGEAVRELETVFRIKTE